MCVWPPAWLRPSLLMLLLDSATDSRQIKTGVHLFMFLTAHNVFVLLSQRSLFLLFFVVESCANNCRFCSHDFLCNYFAASELPTIGMSLCKSSFCLRWEASLGHSGEVWLTLVEGSVKHRGVRVASQTVSMCLSRVVLQQYNQHIHTLTLVLFYNYRYALVSLGTVPGVCLLCVFEIW